MLKNIFDLEFIFNTFKNINNNQKYTVTACT